MGNRNLIMQDGKIVRIRVEAEICDGNLKTGGTGEADWQRYERLVFRPGPERGQLQIVFVSLMEAVEADRKLSGDSVFQARQCDSHFLHISEILTVQYPGSPRG